MYRILFARTACTKDRWEGDWGIYSGKGLGVALPLGEWSGVLGGFKLGVPSRSPSEASTNLLA